MNIERRESVLAVERRVRGEGAVLTGEGTGRVDRGKCFGVRDECCVMARDVGYGVVVGLDVFLRRDWGCDIDIQSVVDLRIQVGSGNVLEGTRVMSDGEVGFLQEGLGRLSGLRRLTLENVCFPESGILRIGACVEEVEFANWVKGIEFEVGTRVREVKIGEIDMGDSEEELRVPQGVEYFEVDLVRRGSLCFESGMKAESVRVEGLMREGGILFSGEIEEVYVGRDRGWISTLDNFKCEFMKVGECIRLGEEAGGLTLRMLLADFLALENWGVEKARLKRLVIEDFSGVDMSEKEGESFWEKVEEYRGLVEVEFGGRRFSEYCSFGEAEGSSNSVGEDIVSSGTEMDLMYML